MPDVKSLNYSAILDLPRCGVGGYTISIDTLSTAENTPRMSIEGITTDM